MFENARSNASSSVAPTSSAVSMNRFDCSASSGFGAGLRGIAHSFQNGNLSWEIGDIVDVLEAWEAAEEDAK
jgi:hypothetical protein